MGSSIAQVVLTVLSVLTVYGMSYFWTRTRLPKQARLKRTAFLANLSVLLLLVFVYQVKLMKRLDIYSTALVFTTIIMGIASVMHHVSIIFRHKAEKHAFIEKIHGPISHLMFYVPLGINAQVMANALFRNAQSFGDIMWSSIFTVSLLTLSLVGVFVGLNKIQLPYA